MKNIKKKLNKKIKRLDIFDIFLIKLSIINSVIIFLKIFPSSINWIEKTSLWWFILFLIIFSARPGYKFFIKK